MWQPQVQAVLPSPCVSGVWCSLLSQLPTCPDTGAAEQLGQAPHAVEGVEVMHVLVQSVHPILVLRVRGRSTVGPGLPARLPYASSRARDICRGLAAPARCRQMPLPGVSR